MSSLETLLIAHRSHISVRREVIVYGVFLATGVAFFAYVRAYAPRLSLLAIFGTIVLDIFCVRAPPNPQLSRANINPLSSPLAHSFLLHLTQSFLRSLYPQAATLQLH